MGKPQLFPFFVLLVFFAGHLAAQPAAGNREDSMQSRFIDISKISLSEDIQENIGFSYLDNKVTLREKYNSLVFNTGAIHKKRIPDRHVTQKPFSVSIFSMGPILYRRFGFFPVCTTGIRNSMNLTASN